MVASTGLVLGHNDNTSIPHHTPLVERYDWSYDQRVILDGYALVGYTQAVEQSTDVVALQRTEWAQAEWLEEAISQRQTTQPTRWDQLPNSGSSSTEIRLAFIQGWRAAGGVEEWLDFVVTVVIDCESSWDVNAYNPAGPFRGLGQWLQSTWDDIAALTGYSDIWNPEHQGRNMAFKSRRDGGFAWPECWEARWN